jgi:hypothetical protein
MLEKHNRMLVQLLSKQHPSADMHSLMKVLYCRAGCRVARFFMLM